MTSYSRVTKAINQRKLFLKKDLASIDFCVIKPSIFVQNVVFVSRIVSRDSGSSGQTFCKVNQIFGDELSSSITTAAGGGFFTVSFFSFFVSFLLYNLGDGEPSISPSLPLFYFSVPNSHSCLPYTSVSLSQFSLPLDVVVVSSDLEAFCVVLHKISWPVDEEFR